MGIETALIGSAVLGAGSSLLGASKASKAANKAADQNAAIQREQYQQTRQDLAPYAGAGNTATTALMSRLGLSSGAAPAQSTYAPPSAANTSAPSSGNPFTAGLGYSESRPATSAAPAGVTMPTGAPMGVAAGNQPAGAGALSPEQIAQITRERPDVAAEAQKALANGSAQQQGATDVNGYMNLWYNQMRQSSGDSYALPASGSTVPGPDAAPVPGQTFTSSNNGGLGDRPVVTRPEFSEQQPTIGQGPQSADYLKDFETSPGYQFRLNEGMRNLNAGYGAKGLLKSGSAIQGVTNYAQGAASSEYGNWFNQQMSRLGADQGQFNNDRAVGLGQYNANRNVFNGNYDTDTARNDNIFNSDRGYNTDQYNAYTGNLFNLTNIGQSAAAGQANAGQNYAAAATANNNSLASVKGNAAIAGANGINNAITSGMQAYGASQNPFASFGNFGMSLK